MKDQGRSTRTKTGGRHRPHAKKKKSQLGRDPTETRVGDVKMKVVETHGGTRKVRALTTNQANVTDDDGATEHAEITDVVENAANPNYARRNIITKGAVVETDAGRARDTSRPGQTGQVNAVRID